MRRFEHEPLAPRTTFGVGGSVRFLFETESTEEISEALRFATAASLPVFILGGGANMLADDGEALGVCIAPRNEELHFADTEAGVEITVGTSVAWDTFVSQCVSRGLWGFENLSAIPGSVGGAVVQNIGAYGASLSQHLMSVEVFDRQAMCTEVLSKEDCVFGYRTSIFKVHPNRFVLLRARFLLSVAGVGNTTYRDVRDYFMNMPAPSLPEIREAICAIRARKFPDIQVEGTAGSFFANPSVTTQEAAALTAQYPELPIFPVPESEEIKIPIAWILDHVLGLKGYEKDGVRLFERQALAIVAMRGTTAAAVRALAREVQEKVFAATGISLVPEVIIMHGAHMTSDISS